jgi:prevent-host-death family protein
MKIAPLADVKARLSAYLVKCETDGPVVITRNGKVAAILLAPKDEEDLERLVLAHSRRFQTLLEKSRRSIKAGKGIPHKEFWKTVAQRHKAKTASLLRKRSRSDRSKGQYV